MGRNWRAEIIRKEGGTVDIRLTQKSVDSGDFFDTRPFALRLVIEPIEFDLATGPLADELPDNAYLDVAWIEIESHGFIANATLVEEQDAYDSYRVRQDLKAEGLSPDSEEFEERRKAAFEDFKENPPQAVLRVELTDAAWGEHLEPGLSWDSPAYA